MKEKKRYKKGHFIEMGLVIGIPCGIPIGLILGNIALGPLLGVILGLGTGYLLESIFNKNPIELKEKERSKIKKMSWIGFIIGLAVFFSILIIFLSIKLNQI